MQIAKVHKIIYGQTIYLNKFFLIKACVVIRNRFALNDPVFETCLDISDRVESIQNILTLMPRLTPSSMVEQQALDGQWRKLAKLKGNFDAAIWPYEFWHKVSN